ncbi:MAG: hypothetical protein RL069_1364, partial [Planctomycetota bacterium]
VVDFRAGLNYRTGGYPSLDMLEVAEHANQHRCNGCKPSRIHVGKVTFQ